MLLHQGREDCTDATNLPLPNSRDIDLAVKFFEKVAQKLPDPFTHTETVFNMLELSKAHAKFHQGRSPNM